jgi:hypothetical protein
MTTKIINTHASKDAANFRPGSHLESVGVFFMIKLPKRMPIDICDRCIEELSQQIGKLEVDFLTHKVKQHVYDYRKMNLDFEVLYWNQCKRLTLKGQPNE